MKNQLIIWMLIFGTSLSVLPGNENDSSCCGSAYAESSHAAYWTPYLPIAVLVVAAIYLGKSHQGERHSSMGYSSHGGCYRKDCYDGLGALAGRDRCLSHYTYAKSYTRCKLCLSH